MSFEQRQFCPTWEQRTEFLHVVSVKRRERRERSRRSTRRNTVGVAIARNSNDRPVFSLTVCSIDSNCCARKSIRRLATAGSCAKAYPPAGKSSAHWIMPSSQSSVALLFASLQGSSDS